MKKQVWFLLVLLLGFSANASAQTSDLIQIDRKHYGYFTVDNVQVSEKQIYKIIHIDVHVKIKDLAPEDKVNMKWNDIVLANENDKTYLPESGLASCKIPSDSKSVITEKDGGDAKLSLCYLVEKQYNNFQVQYQDIALDPINSVQIGKIHLTENLNPDLISGIKNINMTSPQDFFGRLFEMFKILLKLS